MNNKKLIRLTESDLHRIVKESVNKVLKEAQLNELDPRTYASYADKRLLQGKKDKAKEGRRTAVDAWNREYGRGKRDDVTRNWSATSMGDTSDIQDGDWEYFVDDSEGNDGYVNNYNLDRTYYPKDDVSYWTYNNHSNGDCDHAVIQNGKGELKDRNVAYQMQHGNGKYIKGKGWQ